MIKGTILRHLPVLVLMVTLAGTASVAAQQVSEAFLAAYRGYDKAFLEGELEQAAKLAREALRLGIVDIGADHEKTAVLEINLGHTLLELRQIEEAEIHLLRAQQILTSVSSETDLNLVTVYRDLAILRRVQGEYAKARLYYSKELNALRANKGVDDPEIAPLLMNIAQFEASIGEGPKAQNALARAQQIIVKSVGERHPAVAAIMAQRGEIEIRLNKHASAEKYLLDALRMYQEQLAENDPRIVSVHGYLTVVYEQLKNEERKTYHSDKLVELIEDVEGDARPLIKIPPTIPKNTGPEARQGWVLAEYNITADGHASGAKVLESMPEGVFDEAVLASIAKWRFKPRVADGKRVAQSGNRIRVDITPDEIRISAGKLGSP